MTRRATGELEAVELDNPRARAPIEAINEETENAILSMMGRDPNEINWKINVTRVPTNQDGSARRSAEAFLFSTDQSGYDTISSRLIDHYGTGLYRIRLRKNGVIYAAEDLPIECPPGWKPRPIVSDVQAPQPSETASLAQTLSLALKDMVSDLRAEIRELRTQPVAAPVPQTDPIQMFRAMASIMREIGPAQAPQPAVGMDTILKAIEIGKSVAEGSGGGESSWIDLVKPLLSPEGLTAATGMLTTMAKANEGARPRIATPARKPLPPQTTVMVNAPNTTQPAPPLQSDTANGLNGHETKSETQPFSDFDPRVIPQMVAMLCSRAQRGSDPELYADLAFDQIPIEILAQLVGVTDPVAQLADMNPAVADNREWFETYVDAVREGVREWRASNNVNGTAAHAGNEFAAHASPDANGDTSGDGGDSGDG